MDDKLKVLLKQTEDWIEAHKEEFITELQGLTRIPSISRADLAEPGAPFGPDCRKMLDYAMERGKFYGFETEEYEGYAGSMGFGNLEDPIGVFSHLDVVPVGDGWIYPPFDAVYLPEYDAVIGRGSDDNKCAAVAAMFAMRMLREFNWPLKHGIKLYCGLSEETGMHDMIALKEKGMEFPRLSMVPDSGFPVNYGQKGSVSGDLTIKCEGNLLSFEAGVARNMVPDLAKCVLAVNKDTVDAAFSALEKEITEAITVSACEEGTCILAKGVSAHTANPQNGVNAIYVLSRALTASDLLEGSCREVMASLCEMTSDCLGKADAVAYCDEMSGDLTLVYAMANLKDGILSVAGGSRTPITCDVEALLANLTKSWEARGFEVVSTSMSKPYYIDPQDPKVVALQDMFYVVTGNDRKPFVMGGSNYAKVIPNAISFGPGMATKRSLSEFLPEGHGGAHGPDEAVIMEKSHNCAKLYVLALALMDSMMD